MFFFPIPLPVKHSKKGQRNVAWKRAVQNWTHFLQIGLEPSPKEDQSELREIDSLVYPETVQISSTEAAALFEQFDQRDIPLQPTQEYSLNDKVFRVAFYDTPSQLAEIEDSEPDEVDIPINVPAPAQPQNLQSQVEALQAELAGSEVIYLVYLWNYRFQSNLSWSMPIEQENSILKMPVLCRVESCNNNFRGKTNFTWSFKKNQFN